MGQFARGNEHVYVGMTGGQSTFTYYQNRPAGNQVNEIELRGSCLKVLFSPIFTLTLLTINEKILSVNKFKEIGR